MAGTAWIRAGNLKSGKNGKEIELAWLKGVVGFMNTNGGILLIGVDDSGTILGIDADPDAIWLERAGFGDIVNKLQREYCFVLFNLQLCSLYYLHILWPLPLMGLCGCL